MSAIQIVIDANEMRIIYVLVPVFPVRSIVPSSWLRLTMSIVRIAPMSCVPSAPLTLVFLNSRPFLPNIMPTQPKPQYDLPRSPLLRVRGTRVQVFPFYSVNGSPAIPFCDLSVVGFFFRTRLGS